MKAKDLIEALQKMDPEEELYLAGQHLDRVVVGVAQSRAHSFNGSSEKRWFVE